MSDQWKHFRGYVFRGLLASIPIGLSFLVIWFFYVAIDQRIVNVFQRFIGFRIPGLGLLISLVFLYLIGYLASNVLGRKVFGLIEGISNRIPIVKTIYQVGKQLSFSLSLPEKNLFKRAILVDYFKPDVWVIGFVTGEMEDKGTKEKFLKVFIPTAPNPTSGVLVILKESQARESHWTVEEALRMVISAGIIGPEQISIENN